MSRIKPYKYVNPNMITAIKASNKMDTSKGGATIIAAGKKITGPPDKKKTTGQAEGSAAVSMGRATLLSFNRIGGSIESLGRVQAQFIKTLTSEKALITKQAELRRRQQQRARDQAAEDSQERGKLKPVREETKKQVEKTKEKGFFTQLMEKIFGPFKGIVEFALRAIITQAILGWLANPKNGEKIQVFIDTLSTVFKFIFNIAYKSIDFFLTGVANIFGNGEAKGFDRFKQVMLGLGQVLIGIAGFKALSYLNPFNLVKDLIKLLDWFNVFGNKPIPTPPAAPAATPGGAPTPSAKPRAAVQKIASEYGDDAAKYYDDLISRGKNPVQALTAVRSKFKKLPPRPKGPLGQAGDLFDTWKKKAAGGLDNLKSGVMKGWDNVKMLGGSLTRGLRDKLAASGKWFEKGIREKLTPIAKSAYNLLEKKGIISAAKKAGQSAKNAITKIPGYDKVMKKVAKEGGEKMLGKLGGKAIPVIGGLVNLYFAYDRLKSGDKSGAALEALSAILDLSGLFGFVPGPMISMALDAYLFGRDFFPDVVKKENEFLNNIIGGIMGPLKAIQDSLPKIPQLETGGVINKPTLAYLGENGPEAVVPLGQGGGGNKQTQATLMAAMLGSLEGMGPGAEIAKQLLGSDLNKIKAELGLGMVGGVGSGESISKTVDKVGGMEDPLSQQIGTKAPSFRKTNKPGNTPMTLRGQLANVLSVWALLADSDLKKGMGGGGKEGGGGGGGSGSSSGSGAAAGSGDDSSTGTANIQISGSGYLGIMKETMDKGGIKNPNERVMFMAQVGHESGEGRYMEEIASGAAYEGRRDLGNTQPGDGKRYKGRGYIQITGRANYRTYGPKAGVPDAEKHPKKLAQPGNAAKVALAYWLARVNRGAAAKGMDGMNTVTKNINGGLNGLQDRIAKFKKYDKMDAIKKMAKGGQLWKSLHGIDSSQTKADSPPKNAAKSAPDKQPGKFALGGNYKNGYIPASALAPIRGGGKLRKEVAPQFNQMWDDAKAAGYPLGLSSSYRSYEDQVATYKHYGSPRAAKPGSSPHSWGLAVDLSWPSTKGYMWLRKNSKRYGFNQIPGLETNNPGGFEAWHWQVGTGRPSGASVTKVDKSGASTDTDSSSGGDTSGSSSGGDTGSGGDSDANILAEMDKSFNALNQGLFGIAPPKPTPAPAASGTGTPAASGTGTPAAKPAKPGAPAPKPAPTTNPPGALAPGQRPDKALTKEQFAIAKLAREQAKAMKLSGMDREKFVAQAVMSGGSNLSQASFNNQVSNTEASAAASAPAVVPFPINNGGTGTTIVSGGGGQVMRAAQPISNIFK